MNHPSAPLRNGDTADKLGREFRDRQRSQKLRLSVRSRANRARTAILGMAIGVAAVVGISMIEGQALRWYTPAWEALLCGCAGYMLARSRGGFLNGTALFAFAYSATVFLREAGYDSTRIIGRLAEARVVSLHADFAALLSVAVIGGLVGFVSDRR